MLAAVWGWNLARQHSTAQARNNRGLLPLGNVPPFPHSLYFIFTSLLQSKEASDLWDSRLQDGLVESQHLAVLPKAGHLWERGRGYFKPECEKLALQRMKNFPEKGL